MSKIGKKVEKIIKNPYILLAKLIKGKAKFISDKNYLRIMYRASFGKKLDLKNPITYNEKLQYLKLYDRKKEYIDMVDKFEVRKIVKKLIGEEYLIPCYGVWDKFDDIDFNVLPDKFVLKCTHDSGSVFVCKDKSKFDILDVKRKINKAMRRNFFWTSREWPYKLVKPRIIAEMYLEDNNIRQLRDYKFFCFSGKAKYLYIASDRSMGFNEVKFDYFDINFNKLDLCQATHPNSNYNISKPNTYNEMVRVVELLGKNIPHVRIDLYEVNGKIYFGEFTFYNQGGFVPFKPDEFDYIWGDLINIKNI